MNLFRYLAYLAPAAAGFGVTAVLAFTRGRPVRRRLVAALSVLGGVLVALALGALSESFRGFHAAALLVTGFAVLAAGFFLFCEAFRLPPEACQVAAGLLVAGLMGAAFLFAPALRRAEEAGLPMEEISRRIARTLEASPFMVIGYSIFGSDPAHWRTFYPLGLGDYPVAVPRWQAAAAGYAVAGFVFFAAGIVLAFLRHMIKSTGYFIRGGAGERGP